MYWIDSHIHLSSFPENSLFSFFKKSQTRNLSSWVMAGYDSQDWQRQLQISTNQEIYRSFGLHPWRVLELTEDKIQEEMRLLRELFPQYQFMGETGIDGFRSKDKIQMFKQIAVFEEHLDINKNAKKPLVLHTVKAHQETLRQLKKHSFKGLVHGFSGSWEEAQSYIALGYKISVGRGVFRQGYRKLKDALQHLPLESLLLESDAFYGPEESESQAIDIYFQVVEAICKIKNISQEELQAAVFHNIKSLFA